MPTPLPPTPRTLQRLSSRSPTRTPASPTDGSRSPCRPSPGTSPGPRRAPIADTLGGPMNRRSPFVIPENKGLSRRGFLGLTATGLVLAGCGGEGVGGQSSEGVGGFSGEAYDGPKLTLSYWNGFTGGDGPAMQDLVKRFMSEHDNIVIENNTIEWADFYQRL